jgi:hypothetical protein
MIDGLIHPRPRQYPKKQDLPEWKQTWALFQQISADTKGLVDIPPYRPPMKRRGLPFLAYASRRSAEASALFAEAIPHAAVLHAASSTV